MRLEIHHVSLVKIGKIIEINGPCSSSQSAKRASWNAELSYLCSLDLAGAIPLMAIYLAIYLNILSYLTVSNSDLFPNEVQYHVSKFSTAPGTPKMNTQETWRFTQVLRKADFDTDSSFLGMGFRRGRIYLKIGLKIWFKTYGQSRVFRVFWRSLNIWFKTSMVRVEFFELGLIVVNHGLRFSLREWLLHSCGTYDGLVESSCVFSVQILIFHSYVNFYQRVWGTSCGRWGIWLSLWIQTQSEKLVNPFNHTPVPLPKKVQLDPQGLWLLLASG